MGIRCLSSTWLMIMMMIIFTTAVWTAEVGMSTIYMVDEVDDDDDYVEVVIMVFGSLDR